MGFVPKHEKDMSVPLTASCAVEMALGRGLCKKEEVRTKTARNSLISEFRAVYVCTSHSQHKPRPHRILAAWEAVIGTDMSFSHFGTNPIATRFLAVHFFGKNPIFYKPLKPCGFYNRSIGG